MRPAIQSILEFVVITAVGSAIGLAVNGLSGRGVSLTKDYFPSVHAASKPASVEARPAATRPATAPHPQSTDPYQAAAQALRRHGLQPISHDQVVALFNDPLYRENVYLFVDSRDDQNYSRGHIPGALQLDHYRIEHYINQVWPLCQQALKIVTYCNGGDCEDSQFAATDLLNCGLDPGRLFVYPGGFEQWKKSNLPVERGQRGSGDIVPGSQLGDNHE